MDKKNTSIIGSKENITVSTIADEATVTEALHEQENNIEVIAKPAETKPVRYKTKKAAVLSYDKRRHKLAVDVDGYGIMLENIYNYDGSDTYIIKYTGSLGKANFRMVSDVR